MAQLCSVGHPSRNVDVDFGIVGLNGIPQHHIPQQSVIMAGIKRAGLVTLHGLMGYTRSGHEGIGQIDQIL